MLTSKERAHTAKELQENAHRLGYDYERIADEVDLSIVELERVLTMKNPEPGQVWMVRDYLLDMLEKEGKEAMPFSKLINPAVNIWYRYERPWRKK